MGGYEAIGYYRKALLSSKQQKKDEGVHVADPSAQSCYAEVESVDIGSSKWKFLCGHKYQPLKYCLESVRCEFLNLAEELDLFWSLQIVMAISVVLRMKLTNSSSSISGG